MLIRARNRRMDDDELRAVVNSRMQTTTANLASTVSTDRAKSLQYYRGDPLGNEVDGRSRVISRDVQEAVDGIMPSLLKVFASGPPVEFKARRPDAEQQAEQATDLCNYIWHQQNEGFLNYATWFKDALLQRIGCIKVWWDPTQKMRREVYAGITELELKMLGEDDGVEIQSVDWKPDGYGGQSATVHVMIEDKDGRVAVDCIPPEEFLFDYYAKSVQKARLLGHRVEYTVSDLIEFGYDRELIETIPAGDYLTWSPDRLARFENQNGLIAQGDMDLDPMSRRVWVSECYLNVDYDGDGYAEMRKVTVGGPSASVILDNEEVDSHPFAVLTPTIMPHRIEGVSIADQTMDLQEIKSTLWRQTLDNLYLSNSPRHWIVEGRVNVNDMLVSRPGGVVRVKSADSMGPLNVPFVAGDSMGMMEYIDGVRELRTGLPKIGGQLDKDVLNDGGATGANIVNNARLERVELIARNFAETGVKHAFKRVLELVQKYQNKTQAIRLRGSWVTINPREWADGFDMEMKVGLGSGNKDQMLGHLLPIKQTQEQILMHYGPQNPIVGLSEYHNVLSDLVKNAGLGDPSRYWKDPSSGPPMQPPPTPPDPKMIEAQTNREELQMRMQMEKQKAQYAEELAERKAQHEIEMQWARMRADIEIAKAKAQAQTEADARRELYDVNKGAAAAQASDQDDLDDGVGDIMHPHESDAFSGIQPMEEPPLPAAPVPPGVGGMGAPGVDAGGPPPLAPSGAEPESEDSQVQTKILVQMAQSQQETAQAISQAVAMMGQVVAKLGKQRGMRIVRGTDGKVSHSEPIDDE